MILYLKSDSIFNFIRNNNEIKNKIINKNRQTVT